MGGWATVALEAKISISEWRRGSKKTSIRFIPCLSIGEGGCDGCNDGVVVIVTVVCE